MIVKFIRKIFRKKGQKEPEPHLQIIEKKEEIEQDSSSSNETEKRQEKKPTPDINALVETMREISRARMVTIQRVSIYFELLGAWKSVMELGARVHIPSSRTVPEAIQTADNALRLNGKLLAFSSGMNLQVETIKEMSDSEWRLYLDSKSEGLQWRRWSGTKTQGRWNVIVFGTGLY
jgi:hypothetical protein